MGTLYIAKRGYHIKLDGNAMAFYLNGKRDGIIPIEPLERVVFIGSMTIDTNVLKRLTKAGATCIFLSGKRMKFWGRLTGTLHNNAMLRLKQYENLQGSSAMELSRWLVKRKISSQIEFIQNITNQRKDIAFFGERVIQTLKKCLETVEKMDNIQTLNGLEGSASNVYFEFYKKLFADSLKFKKRTRRPPLDPVNSMLSLVYTMLHCEVLREIEIIGLDPFIGFYHQFDYGRESLACDFVELYRCDADMFVYRMFAEQIFRDKNFSVTQEGCYLKKESRQNFFELYEQWIEPIREKIKDEVKNFARIINEGKNSLSKLIEQSLNG